MTIRTPAPDATARPVVVWLHGGAWISGSGSDDRQDGTRLACEGDLVEGWTYDGTTFLAPTASPPTAEQVLAEKIAAGITLTSTGTPALNGTYALDDVSTAQIYQLGLFASQFDTFPGGPTQPYPDAAGVPHMLTVAQFVAFLRAVAPLVSELSTQAAVMAHGGAPGWPAQAATIA